MKDYLFIGVFVAVGLVWVFPKKQEPEPINYELFDYRFRQLERRIDSTWVQIEKAKSDNDSIKLKLLRDEKKIDNLDRHGLDSAFRQLLAR